jgi:hypothetical protein
MVGEDRTGSDAENDDRGTCDLRWEGNVAVLLSNCSQQPSAYTQHMQGNKGVKQEFLSSSLNILTPYPHSIRLQGLRPKSNASLNSRLPKGSGLRDCHVCKASAGDIQDGAGMVMPCAVILSAIVIGNWVHEQRGCCDWLIAILPYQQLL